ncbi:unnamed protein product [Didymodactylos carnosus]|uniref:Uncharacterized protein n=1 Tax=Didymodactylos carnosus TaxID=1234261 RepID=A0A814I844_9BILA|nr:unnamed protein product [Didymodactylos carnosus]CAF1069254.1 unnamed protein product [Didymodactylos carnosus]CAF3793300.1 unnamed protein product [Didymodactylos carnosus]CAF3833783.1 unnamed protein product [Didymodactylos carnosus]
MLRRTRSLSRHRDYTPDHELTPSVYERSYSVERRSDDYPSGARFNKPTNNAYDRWRRSQSVGRFDHLIAGRRRPQHSTYSTHDPDYYVGNRYITPFYSDYYPSYYYYPYDRYWYRPFYYYYYYDYDYPYSSYWRYNTSRLYPRYYYGRMLNRYTDLDRLLGL